MSCAHPKLSESAFGWLEDGTVIADNIFHPFLSIYQHMIFVQPARDLLIHIPFNVANYNIPCQSWIMPVFEPLLTHISTNTEYTRSWPTYLTAFIGDGTDATSYALLLVGSGDLTFRRNECFHVVRSDLDYSVASPTS